MKFTLVVFYTKEMAPKKYAFAHLNALVIGKSCRRLTSSSVYLSINYTPNMPCVYPAEVQDYISIDIIYPSIF